MKPLLLPFLLALLLAFPLPQRAAAQAAEIQQLLLNVEKLNQLRGILSDMKKGYDILHRGYGTVRSVAEGSFSLHDAFLEGLLSVNPHLRQYHRVADILSTQQRLVLEYRDALALFHQHGHFSAAELEHLGNVYARLLAQSLHHLDELALVLTSGTLRMGDDERLAAIERIYRGTADKLAFLRHFNRQTTLLALQRTSEHRDLAALRQFLQPHPETP